MRKWKARINYSWLKNDELAVLTGKVSEALTDNPDFVSPNALIDTFKEAAADYLAKLQMATRGGSKHDIDMKDESRVNLLVAFREVAQAVNSVAQGSAAVISRAGLILGKQPSSLNRPGIILRVRLGDGTVSGEIAVSFQPDRVATEYLIEIGRALPGTETISWEQTFNARSSRKFFISDLDPGTRYYVRVQGRNAVGSGDWSESTSIIAR